MTERGTGTWRLRAYAGRDPLTGSPIQEHRIFKGSEMAAGKALAALVTEVESRDLRQEPGQRRPAAGPVACPRRCDGQGPAQDGLRVPRRKIEGRIRPALGDVALAQLDAGTLDAWHQQWLALGLSPSTVPVYHPILSAACQQAVRWAMLDRAPTELASPPSPKPPTMRVPTPAQLAELIQAAEPADRVLAAAIVLAALTGARRGELVALRWSDVDLELGTVTIERGITVVGRQAVERLTKTHQSRRVALDDLGVGLLRRHWRFVTSRSELVESPLVEDPYVLSYQAHSGISVNPDTPIERAV